MEEDIEYETFDGDIITKSDIRNEIIEDYRQANLDGMTKITDFNIGSEAYHLSDVMAAYVLSHMAENDNCYRMSMIHTMQGEFLDNYGDRVGVHRVGASPSTGEVTFTRTSTDTTDTIIISADTVIATEDSISFILDTEEGTDIVIPAGSMSVTHVPILCEQNGEYTNVLEHTIRIVIGSLAGIIKVDNSEACSGGVDIETDEEYRSRILLAPYNEPCGSLAWYKLLAEELESVHDVFVEKGITVTEADINITYNPSDWENTETAYNELVNLFSLPEYDIVGITMYFDLCQRILVLSPDTEYSYIFAVLLEPDYSIDSMKPDIIAKIQEYNRDCSISMDFSPSTLSTLISTEIEGIERCMILEYNRTDGKYREVVAPIQVNLHELAQADLTNIENRITKITWDLDIDPFNENNMGG